MQSTSPTFRAASKGFSYLLSFQLASKLVTFIANALLIRKLNVETKGMVFTLELFVMSILYLSREPLRRACLRVKLQINDEKKKNDDTNADDDDDEYRNQLYKMKQIAWLIVPYGLIICWIGYSWFDWFFNSSSSSSSSTSLSTSTPFKTSLILHLISCLIALLSEPFYITAQNLLLYSVRFRIEGMALIVKVLVSLLLVTTILPDSDQSGGSGGNVLIAFGISQIVYQSYITLGYILHFYQHSKTHYHFKNGITDLLPWSTNTGTIRKSSDDDNNQEELLWLAGGFGLQTIVKFVLTDGEKYVLMIYQSLSDQGIYDVVSQLGSLAARLIFQSIEENAFTIWSKSLNKNKIEQQQEEQQQQQQQENVRNSAIMLQLLIKLFMLIGCYFVFFGPSYSYTLLHILYGSKWTHGTEAPRVLSFYCLYVMMMALNGTTEGFVHAASTPKQTQIFNVLMFVFSGVYLSCAILCLTVFQLGTVSLIIANCANMVLRVVSSTIFILNYFKQNSNNNHKNNNQKKKNLFSIGECIPHGFIWMVFAVSFVITKWSESQFEKSTIVFRCVHISIGTLLLLITMVVIRWKEGQFIRDVWKLFTGKLQ